MYLSSSYPETWRHYSEGPGNTRAHGNVSQPSKQLGHLLESEKASYNSRPQSYSLFLSLITSQAYVHTVNTERGALCSQTQGTSLPDLVTYHAMLPKKEKPMAIQLKHRSTSSLFFKRGKNVLRPQCKLQTTSWAWRQNRGPEKPYQFHCLGCIVRLWLPSLMRPYESSYSTVACVFGVLWFYFYPLGQERASMWGPGKHMYMTPSNQLRIWEGKQMNTNSPLGESQRKERDQGLVRGKGRTCKDMLK